MPENKMRVIFSPKARAQMLRLVTANSEEVAWHGTVDRTSDSEFAVDEILLYPQRATVNTVTTDEGEYAAWLASLPDEVFGHLRFHGHSHVNMPALPSSTDLDQQASIVKQLSSEDYYIFMIVNRRFESRVWIYDLKTGRKYGGTDIDASVVKNGPPKARHDVRRDAERPEKAGKPEDKGGVRNGRADGYGMV